MEITSERIAKWCNTYCANSSNYKSASASIVGQVAQVVEDVIGGAEGIKNIDSKSENGRNTINVEFDTSIDLDNAANDIREELQELADNLSIKSSAQRAAGLQQLCGYHYHHRRGAIWRELNMKIFSWSILKCKNVGRMSWRLKIKY